MEYKCSCGAHTSNVHVFEQHISKCLIFKALPQNITINRVSPGTPPTPTKTVQSSITTTDIYVPLMTGLIAAVAAAECGEPQ
jgi:hypothetical protein